MRDPGLQSLASTALTPATLETPAPSSTTSACLVVIFGGDIGKRVVLSEQPVVIGRASAADLQLESDNVSRVHASVRRVGRGFVLQDEGSTNGTFVNEHPVRSRELQDGDQIRIGRARLKFLTSSHVEAQYHEEIYRLMTLDGLTQIYNRRYFQEALDREFSRSRRYRHPFSLVLLDVDHFKQVNDRYGHPAGDSVLQAVAQQLKRRLRENDLVARLGGEEFAVLCPETPGVGAVALAEKLRLAVEHETISHEGNVIRVTVSGGVATFEGSLEQSEQLLKLADEQLYAAKDAGRNRILGPA